jgi:hypothetical protein
MTEVDLSQQEISFRTQELIETFVTGLTTNVKLAIVKAPPGSGKTFTLLGILNELIEEHGFSVALAAQTNNQANDIVSEFTKRFSSKIVRLGASKTLAPAGFPAAAEWETNARKLSKEPGLYVSTTAKWTFTSLEFNFDLLAIDESWQMPWSDFMRCAELSDRFLMIGDPGQIEPVTTIDVARWGTSDRPPHKATPAVVISDPQFDEIRIVGELPSCRRLPAESVPYIRPFYDFHFSAFAEPKERVITYADGVDPDFDRAMRAVVDSDVEVDEPGWVGDPDEPIDKLLMRNSLFDQSPTIDGDLAAAALISRMKDCEPVLATIPTSPDGPPAEIDRELAIAIHRIVRALLNSAVKISTELGEELRAIRPEDIGVCASHRKMNGEITKKLGPELSGISVDTPERWQGLQKPIMIAVHPLSGVTAPSQFDLSTGRLCVMASRHQVGMIFVARDHVGKTIEDVIPYATQAPGQPDDIGRGRRAHLEFWNLLKDRGRVVSMV